MQQRRSLGPSQPLLFTAHQWLHLFVISHSSPFLASPGLYFLSKGSRAGERPREETRTLQPTAALKEAMLISVPELFSWKVKSAFSTTALCEMRCHSDILGRLWGCQLSYIYGNISLCVTLLAIWNSAFRQARNELPGTHKHWAGPTPASAAERWRVPLPTPPLPLYSLLCIFSY